ncbi:MAG: YXWGXW repeat-containing protein [Betaproteobacteria bacterium]
MRLRKTLVAVLCAAALGAVAVPMTASAQVVVYFNSAPPALRYEAVPAPRRGYVWSAGYWNVKHNRHVWQAGHWEKQRKGYAYAQPNWTQQNNRWELQRSHWNKGDRDHDGVPNQYDRAPDNPSRR